MKPSTASPAAVAMNTGSHLNARSLRNRFLLLRVSSAPSQSCREERSCSDPALLPPMPRSCRCVRPAAPPRRREEDRISARTSRAAGAPLLDEDVALREPEPDQEQHHHDDDEQEDREEVVADAARRRVNSRAAARRVMRAARGGDEPEEHEHPAPRATQSATRSAGGSGAGCLRVAPSFFFRSWTGADTPI